MSTTPVRQPAGVPTGGQFAAKSNPEAEFELEDIQPTQVLDPDGTESWWQHGELHRDDGPAVIDPDGTESWYQHGELHRDGGPAIVFPNGDECWYQHDQGVPPPTQSPSEHSTTARIAGGQSDRVDRTYRPDGSVESEVHHQNGQLQEATPS